MFLPRGIMERIQDIMIFDTHAHYDDEQFDTDREELLGAMESKGIGTIVNASASPDSWDKVVELTEKYSFIYGMIGVHPDDAGMLNEQNFARMCIIIRQCLLMWRKICLDLPRMGTA